MQCHRDPHVTRIHHVAFQKNQSGFSSFSFSSASFDVSPGTTIPHAPRSAFSLATGNTFVPKSALFAFEAVDLICSPLLRTISCNHSVFTASALTFHSPALCAILAQPLSRRNAPSLRRISGKSTPQLIHGCGPPLVFVAGEQEHGGAYVFVDSLERSATTWL